MVFGKDTGEMKSIKVKSDMGLNGKADGKIRSISVLLNLDVKLDWNGNFKSEIPEKVKKSSITLP